jgi:thioesterase domain-containing protein/acyl carrier protein
VSLAVGGEACPGPLAARWAPGRRMLNFYGPTEITVYALRHLFVAGTAEEPPIGRPAPGAQVYLLDRDGRIVPAGTPGEICIAGVGLARGYLARPALTAQRFVPHPLATLPGERLYRTGDLGRHRPDGTFEFLGRIDQQVKLRGLRIELGEIEAVLSRHPAVREARVIVRTDGAPGDKSLVGYLLPAGEEVPTVAELRDFLREHLPEYMIPSAFAAVAAWPLTPNGKVDAAALPAPQRAVAQERIAPRDTLEHELASLFEEVLGVEAVSVRDDFFSLGGHSLLAVRLMARIQEQTGRTLPLTALFTAGTVEGLAALLRETDAPEQASNLIPLQSKGARPPFFWVHPAGGDVLCYALLARHLGTEQPVYGIQARGFARDEEPPSRIEEMAALYIDEIRRLQPAGPYFLGGWSLGGAVAFEMARQLRALGESVALLAVVDGAPHNNIEEAGDESGEAQDSDAHYLLDIAAYVGNFWGRDPEVSPERLEALGPDGQIAYVAERLAAVDFLPPGTGEVQLRRVLAVYRANTRAVRRYQPGDYPGPEGMVVLRATERPQLPGVLAQDDLGWSEVVGGPVEVLPVPGNHLTLLAEPQVRAVAARLRECLERARAGEMETVR